MALAASAVLGACQANRPPNNPGALPAARTDKTPRLNASTYVAHGHLLEQQGQFEQAAAQYREALQIAPDLPTARVRLGITLNKLGRHAEATQEFRAAVARSGSSAFLHNNLGFSLYLEGNYQEAEQVLAHAVELQPSFRRAQMNHGLALGKLGRYEEALAAFCLAGPKPDAYYNLAVLQSEAGDYGAAAQALQNALVLNPKFEEARQQLREVARLSAAQETERAARDVELAAQATSDDLPEIMLARDAGQAAHTPQGTPVPAHATLSDNAALHLLGIPPNMTAALAPAVRSRLAGSVPLWVDIWERVRRGLQEHPY